MLDEAYEHMKNRGREEETRVFLIDVKTIHFKLDGGYQPRQATPHTKLPKPQREEIGSVSTS